MKHEWEKLREDEAHLASGVVQEDKDQGLYYGCGNGMKRENA
jgi:hypothetical protein